MQIYMKNGKALKTTGGGYFAPKASGEEKWRLNESIDNTVAFNYTIKFSSNDTPFESIQLTEPDRHDHTYLYYGETIVLRDRSEWDNKAYRTITFLEPPTGDLLTWLQQNGTKQ